MIQQKSTMIQVLETVRALSLQDQIDLLEQIAEILRASLLPSPMHSILELEGLGAYIWQGVKAQEYVNQERASWLG